MAGLLDMFGGMDDPRTVGLLGLAMGLMQKGTTPGRATLGEAFANGLGGGMQGYMGAKKAQEEAAYKSGMLGVSQGELDLRKKQMEQQEADKKRALEQQQAAMSILMPRTLTDMSPTNANAARMDAGQPLDTRVINGLKGMPAEQLGPLQLLTGKDLTKEWTLANVPQKAASPGDWVLQDGKFVQLKNTPEFNQQAAEQAGAVAAATKKAEAPYGDPVALPGTGAGGATTYVPRPFWASQNGGPIVGENPLNIKAAEEDIKTAADQYKAISQAAFNAPTKISKYQQLGKLIGDFEGGKLTGMSMEGASLLNSLGIKIDPALGQKQAAEAITRELALTLRNPSGGAGMPGALSNDDRNFLVSMVPQLAMSADGRKILINSAVALENRNQQVYDMAAKWKNRYNRLDAVNPATGKNFFQNLQEWSSRYPLFGAQGQ